jgi:hypothetical protein
MALSCFLKFLLFPFLPSKTLVKWSRWSDLNRRPAHYEEQEDPLFNKDCGPCLENGPFRDHTRKKPFSWRQENGPAMITDAVKM